MGGKLVLSPQPVVPKVHMSVHVQLLLQEPFSCCGNAVRAVLQPSTAWKLTEALLLHCQQWHWQIKPGNSCFSNLSSAQTFSSRGEWCSPSFQLCSFLAQVRIWISEYRLNQLHFYTVKYFLTWIFRMTSFSFAIHQSLRGDCKSACCPQP